MNKQVKEIRDEIERRKKICEGVFERESDTYYQGKAVAYGELLSFIDSLPEEKPSKDLEEAAEEYEQTRQDTDARSDNEIVRRAFKAGAKWQKEQMLEDAVELGTTDIYWEPDGDRAFPTFDPPAENLLMPDIISQRFKDGDRVKIIIVKDDENNN